MKIYKQYEATERRKQWVKEYNQTPERKEYWKKYRQSDARKIVVKKYEQSEKGKATRQLIKERFLKKNPNYYKQYMIEYNKQYFQSEKGKEGMNKYLQSQKGRTNRIKMQTLREQRLNFIPIMSNPFPKEVLINWHHINNILVVPTPKTIHQSHPNIPVQNHRENCNMSLARLGFDLTVFNK